MALIKNKVRSIMSYRRLSALELLSVENDVLEYKKLLNNLMLQKPQTFMNKFNTSQQSNQLLTSILTFAP